MLVVCRCCWRKSVSKLMTGQLEWKLQRIGGIWGLIKLDKRRNLVIQWLIRCPCGLDMGWWGPWLASPPLGTRALFLQYRQSILVWALMLKFWRMVPLVVRVLESHHSLQKQLLWVISTLLKTKESIALCFHER
jgi:hypothetical protein